MSSVERTEERKEVPALSEEALRRGQEFVAGLETLQQALDGLQLGQEHSHSYYFTPKSGQYMVVVPKSPIERKLLGFKYHKGTEEHETTQTTEPFVVTRVEINGLASYRGESTELEIIGTSPSWKSENGYTAHSWSEQYAFNPSEHQIAIVDDSK